MKRLSRRYEIGALSITDYDSLVAYLVTRRHALGWSTLELDERAGFPTGYSTKLENFRGSAGRVAGSTSLPLWLETLGIKFKPIADRPQNIHRPKLNGAQLAQRVPT